MSNKKRNSKQDTQRMAIAKWLFISGIFLILFSWIYFLVLPEIMIRGCVDMTGLSCLQRYERLSETADSLIEFSKMIVLPIISLVVGYYFSKK